MQTTSYLIRIQKYLSESTHLVRHFGNVFDAVPPSSDWFLWPVGNAKATKLTDNNALSASACRVILAWMPRAPEGTVLLWLRRRLADLFRVTVGGREVYSLSRAPSLLPP